MLGCFFARSVDTLPKTNLDGGFKYDPELGTGEDSHFD